MTMKDILVNGVVVGSCKTTGNNVEDARIVSEFLKSKGLHQEVTINDAMYQQANSFATVANDLYEKGLKKSPYNGSCVPPFVVNGIFSVELYLKAIHNVYGNKIRGHHLASIYKGMPRQGKEYFLSAAKDIRPKYSLKEGQDIHSCLDSLSRAFEQWRYLYENNGLETEIQSVRYTMHVAHEACCRARESARKT